MRGLILILVVSVLASAQAPAPAPGQTRALQKKAAVPKKEDAFLSGPEFSLDQLVDAAGAIPPARLREAVLKRGISFVPSPGDYEKLKGAGAPPEVIQAIQIKAPAPKLTPRVTPPVVAGTLTLRCVPAECEVAINGRPRGRTDKGTIELHNLPVGEVAVDFKKDGYESQQIPVPLREGARVSKSVTLLPTAATKEFFGKQLFAQMIERLGGKAAFADAANLTAEGDASLFPQGGQQTDWKVIARLKLPTKSYMELSGAKMKWWTSISGTDSKADGTKQLKGGAIPLEMEKLVRLYRDYQPASLVARIQTGNPKLSAASNELDTTGQATFLVRFEAESYAISVNSDGLPVRVKYESASGLGSGLEVVYSDYAPVGKAKYPKSMAIKYAGQTQRGIDLHFATVKFVPQLSDKDLKR